jgi:putative FmdB family regulatory protein
MPTYEYECQDCGKHFEFFQSISEPKKEKCEECGGRLTKLLSAGSGLIFKGSGFYITDYKTKTGGESASGSKAEGSGESKSGDSKSGSETKAPAKTAEAAPAPSSPTKTD